MEKYVYIDYVVGMACVNNIYKLEVSNEEELIDKLRGILYINEDVKFNRNEIYEFEWDFEWKILNGLIRNGKLLKMCY